MKISLKESFRLMNFVDSTINSLSCYIKDTNNAVKVVEKHFKSKSNPETSDEELDMTTERTYSNATVVDIVYLVKQLVDEKTKLSVAIENAKKSISIGDGLTLDSAVESAKKSRELANSLKVLVDLKSSETKKFGRDYKFNINGDQVPYQYEVTIIKTIDYDRNVINDNYKKLLDNADKLSTSIENSMLIESVDYDFPYSIHDSLTDIVDKYLAGK